MTISFTTETRHPESPCVECGHPLSASGGPCEAKPGDLSLCIYCGSLNAFADDMTLRMPTVDEFLEVAADSEFQEARRALMKMIEDRKFSIDAPAKKP